MFNKYQSLNKKLNVDSLEKSEKYGFFFIKPVNVYCNEFYGNDLYHTLQDEMNFD